MAVSGARLGCPELLESMDMFSRQRRPSRAFKLLPIKLATCRPWLSVQPHHAPPRHISAARIGSRSIRMGHRLAAGSSNIQLCWGEVGVVKCNCHNAKPHPIRMAPTFQHHAFPSFPCSSFHLQTRLQQGKLQVLEFRTSPQAHSKADHPATFYLSV